MKYAILDENNKVINITNISNDLTLEKLQRRGFNLIPIKSSNLEIDDIYDYKTEKITKHQPFPSWILNKDTNEWESPKKINTSDKTKDYYWDETIQDFVIAVKGAKPSSIKIIPPIQK